LEILCVDGRIFEETDCEIYRSDRIILRLCEALYALDNNDIFVHNHLPSTSLITRQLFYYLNLNCYLGNHMQRLRNVHRESNQELSDMVHAELLQNATGVCVSDVS
jgi:hypothetical protein